MLIEIIRSICFFFLLFDGIKIFIQGYRGQFVHWINLTTFSLAGAILFYLRN